MVFWWGGGVFVVFVVGGFCCGVVVWWDFGVGVGGVGGGLFDVGVGYCFELLLGIVGVFCEFGVCGVFDCFGGGVGGVDVVVMVLDCVFGVWLVVGYFVYYWDLVV